MPTGKTSGLSGAVAIFQRHYECATHCAMYILEYQDVIARPEQCRILPPQKCSHSYAGRREDPRIPMTFQCRRKVVVLRKPHPKGIGRSQPAGTVIGEHIPGMTTVN